MNMDMPVFASHKSSIGNFNANTLSVIIYIIPLLLSFIPYVQYAAWLIPLFILFKEKDSDLVKYSAAQCTIIFFVMNVTHLVLSIFPTLFSTASSCIITAIINIPKAPFPSVLYILIFLVASAIAAICAKYAGSYMTYRIKFISSIADKLAA